MAPVKSSAVVLRRHRLGETSCVVVCYTRDHGKVRLVAKGVRKGGGRFGAALDPFVVSGVVFYLREGRDLSLVSQAEPQREFRNLRRDVVRQAYAAVALELVERLVADRAPDPWLFERLCAALEAFDQAPEEELAWLLWSFEMELADRLGYAPELGACASCGKAAGRGAGFSTEAGGVVCGSCGAEAGFGPDVLAVLRRLRDGSPPVGGGIPDTVGDEVGRALRGLLEHHSGQSMRLRSQAVLESLERTRRSHAAGRGPHKEEN